MALINCIECGSSISSFAAACPHCGCPSKHQNIQEQSTGESSSVDQATGKLSILKNQERWENAVELFKQKRGQETIKIVEDILGKNMASNEILCQIIRTKEIPYELIIEKFPDQAAQPIIKKPEPTMTTCTACSRPISVKAETCPHCGNPTGVHTCPRCGSTDWVYIDAVSKVGAMALFGAFAVNTVRNKYQCRACKFKY